MSKIDTVEMLHAMEQAAGPCAARRLSWGFPVLLCLCAGSMSFREAVEELAPHFNVRVRVIGGSTISVVKSAEKPSLTKRICGERE